MFLGWVTINNMVRIGANYAALNPRGFETNDPAVSAVYRTLMSADAAGIDCTLPEPLPGPAFSGYDLGDDVSVELSCGFVPFTPFLADLVVQSCCDIPISATAIFNVRSGSVNDVAVNPPRITPQPSASPSSSPDPSASPEASPTPDPSASIDPSASPATPEPTLPPVEVSFYGEPAPGQPDAYGGGIPGSVNENQIVGYEGVAIDFHNTTIGTQVVCVWEFGDGATQTNCADTVTRLYTDRGAFTVTLTVNGSSVSRQEYVLISCKVPSFQGTSFNSADETWSAAGFTGSVTAASGSNGNFTVNYQSIVGGQVNPPGGCGASIVLGR
jgi:hypothetical protein